MNNDIKTQLQTKWFDLLKDKRKVILKWATGCGKSKMAIDLINHAVDSFSRKPVRILFVVAERAHIKNWQEEFEKWHLRSGMVSTDVVCYASLHKYKDFTYDIIVFDETHHLFTEKRMMLAHELYDNMHINPYVFLLSATLSPAKVMLAEDMFGRFTTSTVTLKEAISSDILPDPKVYLIPMDLDNTIANQEIVTGEGFNLPVVSWDKRFNYITRKQPCIIRCTEKQKYLHITNEMEYWKQRYERSHNDFQKNRWVNLGSKRKRYLGELKTDAVRQLVSLLPRKRRYVCFCASVAQANELCAENTISSKRSSNLNQMIIDAFNKKKLHNIYAVGMITEGMNLTNIEAGIIVQLDGKERLFVQKCGRVMRADDPTAFIFYYRGTQDEVYLKNALENIDEKYIKEITINELRTIRL